MRENGYSIEDIEEIQGVSGRSAYRWFANVETYDNVIPVAWDEESEAEVEETENDEEEVEVRELSGSPIFWIGGVDGWESRTLIRFKAEG